MASGSSYLSLKPTKEGTVPFLIPGAGKHCFTFFKIFGNIESPTKVPCVLLHGGPGVSHDYMLSYLPLFERFGIPLVLYDQIGNGLSTHLDEKGGDEEFWTEELFHEELSNLLRHFKLNERGYDLVGHSWGGMMASTFAGKNPRGLRKLVLSNAPATMKSFTDAYISYRSKLPQRFQDALKRHEDAGTEESREYQDIMMEQLLKKHMITTTPWPEEYHRTFEWGMKDKTVSPTMNGPSSFEVTGSLRNWSAVEAAKKINVPTLVINGTDECATDEAVKPFVEGIKDVKWLKLKKSTHAPMWEETETYFNALKEFLFEK